MLLPPIQRTGEITFHVAKALPYRARLALSFGFMAVGLGLQALWLPEGPWAVGLIPVFAGVLLLLPRGYRNAPDMKSKKGEWRPARKEEVRRIIEINERQKRWDSDFIDITSGWGLLALIGLGVTVFLALGWLERAGVSPRTGAMVAANAAVLLVPFWITGIRFILKNDRLVIRAKMFLDVEEALSRIQKDGEEFLYQVQTAKAKDGEVPQDVKAILVFRDGSPEFLGLQMQIAINSVQGTDYPYFYCVLVAKSAFGPLGRENIESPPANVVIKAEPGEDVNIVVIRQRTTKKSGYHTNLAAATEIFRYALGEARRLVRSSQRR